MSEFDLSQLHPVAAFDSRGTPTVSCEVVLRGGGRGTAIVPSGASTGGHEAIELRDEDDAYGGRGVGRALANIRDAIAPIVIGLDARDQGAVDEAMERADGTAGLGVLGANAVLAVSVAGALAGADQAGVPAYRWFAGPNQPLLPLPMVNIISGGAHAGGAIDVQDYLVVPVGASTFSAAIEWVWRVRAATREVLIEAGYAAVLVADEGGFGEPLTSNTEALDLVLAGIQRAGLEPGRDVGIALDIAANELRDGDDYRFAAEDRSLSAAQLVEQISAWCATYPIVSVEDVLAEDDWDGWKAATAALAGVQLVGDDLFATSSERIAQGIEAEVANAVLVKPNQAGTLSRTRAALDRARAAGYRTVLSARSGDTEDSWLADLVVGWRGGQIKVGSLTRSERLAKWNRLLRIESELGPDSPYAGRAALAAGDLAVVEV